MPRLSHRGDQANALALAEWVEEAPSNIVRAPVELGALLAPTFGQMDDAHPPVMVTGSDADELFPLESSQHPAGVSGVETEPRPQRADLYALEPDLPKGPRLAH